MRIKYKAKTRELERMCEQ